MRLSVRRHKIRVKQLLESYGEGTCIIASSPKLLATNLDVRKDGKQYFVSRYGHIVCLNAAIQGMYNVSNGVDMLDVLRDYYQPEFCVDVCEDRIQIRVNRPYAVRNDAAEWYVDF